LTMQYAQIAIIVAAKLTRSVERFIIAEVPI
jgi:hypothetical protein